MKKVLITGANSYIGTSFENWIKENHDEIITDTLDMIGDAWREYDFGGYDVVFHVAGIAHQKETKKNAESYYRVNKDLAIETAQRAKEAGVRQFIILSSMSVYGTRCGVITKATRETPTTHYGKAKYQADLEIAKMNDEKFKVCILRPPMVYGKGCKGNYQLLRKLSLRTPIFPKVSNDRSMIYVTNLIVFVEKMILEEASGIFFPQNERYVNTSDMVKAIAEVHKKKVYMISFVEWMVKIMLALRVGLFEKVFGSLTYEKVDLCNTVNFDDSIIETENSDEEKN